MKKKLLTLVMLLFVVSPGVLARQPAADDKVTDWIGRNPPLYQGVSYRYCRTCWGQGTWSADFDSFQFQNENSYPVEIKWRTSKGVAGQTNRLEGNTVDELINIAPGDRLSSIGVRRL